LLTDAEIDARPAVACAEAIFVLNMGWPADLTWYRLLTDWGSLIGGGFALVAGAALYIIGRHQVRATTQAADREIAATRETISAAQEQTRVAQEQIAVTLRVERERIARESYAFHAMLEAAMATVVEDIEAAREIFAPESHHVLGESILAYQAGQRIRKTAFADLRSACVRLGGQLTTSFLRLDKIIDEFAADWITVPSAGDPIRKGTNAGLKIWLDVIEQRAVALREEASDEMKRCATILAETRSSNLP
jgi:hypothetical protein